MEESMEEHQLSRSFRKLTRLHREIVANYLETYGLYPGQPRLLFMIDENPGLTLSRLVQESDQTKEAISVSIRRMCEAGYIRKENNPKDQREKFLYLTQQGKATADIVHAEFHRINEAMFEPLNDDEKAMLESMFIRMTTRLNAFKGGTSL
jgi:DNA-binding MarR family transcriptional regulator